VSFQKAEIERAASEKNKKGSEGRSFLKPFFSFEKIFFNISAQNFPESRITMCDLHWYCT